MKNFGEENKYLQKIEIVDEIIENTVAIANYDVQVFPQGGYLLEGVENTLGLKALLNGRSVNYTGRILDSEKKKVAQFSNEHLGMCKVDFYYLPSENYTAEFKTNDTIINVKIPKAKSKGVVLNTTKSTETTLNLELKTNLKSVKEAKKNYTLLFHQNSKLVDYVGVNIVDTSAIKFSVPKAGFISGVNTVTVFEESTPILERKFFVYKKTEKQEVILSKLTAQNDSIIYKLKLKDAKVNSNMSLSVLRESSNYLQTATIESAFLLTPYVKGYVENPAYYFNEDNKNRLQHIDILLLTQGWEAYTTDTYIKKIRPKKKYNFEQGFSLKGSVTPLKSNVLALLSKNNQIVTETFLNGKHDFKFKNLLVFKGDSIKLSFLKGTGVNFFEKPRNISFDTVMVNKEKLAYYFQKRYSKFEKVYTEEQKVGNLNIKGINKLDEVEIKGKRKVVKGVLDKAFIDKYRKQVFDLGAFNELDIPEKYIKNNLTLEVYLREDRGLKIIVDELGREQLSDNIPRSIGGRIYRFLTAVILDGIDLRKPGVNVMSLTQVGEIKMEYIKTVAFNHGAGPKHPYDRIAIFTTENYKKGIKEVFKHYVFKNGYDKSKKYYSPLYNYATGTENQEIDWKPNLVTNALGETVFKIKNNEANNRKMFVIQGYTEHGKLISSSVFLD